MKKNELGKMFDEGFVVTNKIINLLNKHKMRPIISIAILEIVKARIVEEKIIGKKVINHGRRIND